LEDKSLYSSRKRLSADIPGVPGMDDGFDSVRYSLKACKQEGDSLGDDADNIFNLFASLFDSSLTGRYRKINVVQFPFTVKFG
jgi:nuclear pore complex protein Nup107